MKPEWVGIFLSITGCNFGDSTSNLIAVNSWHVFSRIVSDDFLIPTTCLLFAHMLNAIIFTESLTLQSTEASC